VIRSALVGASCLVEPFVGGFHVVPEVRPDQGVAVLCSDLHPGLEPLYRAVAGGWEPPLGLSRATWEHLRRTRAWEDPRTGFAAFGCSYGGREFQGYAKANARGYLTGDSTARRLVRVRPWLARCRFRTCGYHQVEVPLGAVVYCDPPYGECKPYEGLPQFDRAAFFAWCEAVAYRRSATVLVSEFQGGLPSHWEVLWSRERVRELGPRVRKTEILARAR
jgi:DNA adenine methylase